MQGNVSPQDTLVAVAMSGGVDSSVAALLLKQAGYRLVGLTMMVGLNLKPCRPSSGKMGDSGKSCCTVDSALDARRVCDQLGIPHYMLDMREEFEERVVRPFYQSYMRGETPNPCVDCNRFIKWDALWKRARAIGATRIATGHYAAVTGEEDGSAYILRGGDAKKDQSYFLWGVSPGSLRQTLFPLGALSKPEVRRLAAEAGLRIADKRESQDICFVPGGDYREFVAERAGMLGDVIAPGPMLGPEGVEIGKHRGLAHYTIGQRKGLGVAIGEPLFVRRLEPGSNTVALGRKEDLNCRAFVADGFNGFGPEWTVRECLVQYRYRSPAKPAIVERKGGDEVLVTLRDQGYGVSPGQSVVFYDGVRLLGGAHIREVIR